jgi:hypothetical protein
MKSWHWINLTVAAVLAVSAWFIFDGMTECSPWRLYPAVQNSIANELKSPSTAKFPDRSETTWAPQKHLDCVYVVSGYVDAQNSFGATVRSDYRAQVIKGKNTKTFLLSLKSR